jgi:hypothetical protein
MGYLSTTLLAIAVIGTGWFVGRMMHNFTSFIIDVVKRQDRDD